MMTRTFSGTTPAADEHRLFTLKNAGGMNVMISERDASLWSWRAPDRYGRMANVLLPVRRQGPAARWQGCHADCGVSLLLLGPCGASVQRANYRLEDDGCLSIDHEVMAMVPTRLEVVLHPSFNLNGGDEEVGDHILQIDADYFVEVSAAGDPVGVAPVGGTAFDFRHPAPIGTRLRWPDSQVRLNSRFNHCFFVRNHFAGGQGPLREVACVFDPGSGRRLQMHTTEAAVQFCSGRQGGFSLDAKAHPALTSEAWPHIIVPPGQVYRQTTVYKLSLEA